MAESIEVFRYISYLQKRWRWIASSCAIALVIAFAATMAMPRAYTATARIVVEPPAGADLRSAMAVSPVYLESLKTYEHFASSDSVFRKAVDILELRASLGGMPIESLKKRVLKVGIVRNTRILEISATMPEPRKAQAVANLIAQSTVELARTMVSEGDQTLIRGIEQQQAQTVARLKESEEAWARAMTTEPLTELQAAMTSATELRGEIRKLMLFAEQEIAEAAAQEKAGDAADPADLRKQAANARARLVEMTRQIESIDRQQVQREKLLAQRSANQSKLDAERKARQGELVAIEAKLREARGEAGYRGERLRIIDPGIVPERPSSPNLPLNLAAALLAGLVLPVLYLTLERSYQEQRLTARRAVYHD